MSMIEQNLPSSGGNGYVFHHFTVEKENIARFGPPAAAEKPGWEGENDPAPERLALRGRCRSVD
jgi:hypothetical protein